jgi:hypothetical protein
MTRAGIARVLVAAALALRSTDAWGFPPYRSTDAETAEPATLEMRLGLVRVQRKDRDDAYESPLLRANLGLVENLELVSELAYGPEEGRLLEGALGFKGVSPPGPLRVGLEALALLPVSSHQSGVGVESQLVSTFSRAPWLLHVNVGGFYDPRFAEIERGWRASVLLELEVRRSRAGIELFAKQVHGDPTIVQAGPGAIVDLGSFDLRTALHVGLSREAPDLMGSVWVTWRWKLR